MGARCSGSWQPRQFSDGAASAGAALKKRRAPNGAPSHACSLSTGCYATALIAFRRSFSESRVSLNCRSSTTVVAM